MLNFISIPKECVVNKTIPVEKVIEKATLVKSVKEIIWEGCLKLETIGIQSTNTNALRYDELQILFVELTDRECLYDVVKIVFQTIKYPCLIEIKVGDATIIGVDTFKKGKIDSDQNTHIGMHFSHWLREDSISDAALKMVESINNSITASETIEEVVYKLYSAIDRYPLSGITKAHLERLLSYMVGYDKSSIRKTLKKYAVPIKWYLSFNQLEKYDKEKRSTYRVLYDKEELWYCFNACEETRAFIQRHPNIEELIAFVDNKYEELEENPYRPDRSSTIWRKDYLNDISFN